MRHPQTIAEISAAIAKFRLLCDLRTSPYQDLIPLPSPTPLPTIPPTQSTNTGPNLISAFSLRLLDYCAQLAYRILCTRDSPSLRLARRIFQYRLDVDAHRGESNTLDYLRECLGCWAKTLAESHDKAIRFAKKTLASPRWPGEPPFNVCVPQVTPPQL